MQPTVSPPTIPLSKPHHSKGLLMGFIVVLLLFVASLVFAVWAYAKMQDYKNNVNQKITAASAVVSQQVSAAKDKQFAEEEKNPLKTYTGPDTYGSVSFQYPKTWSAYIDQTNQSTPVNGYFNPDFVPGITTSGTTYALRVQIVNEPYSQQLQRLSSLAKNGDITISAYRAPKVPGTLGSEAVGAINTGEQDTEILLPVRDTTLVIWTESPQYLNDFNTYVLPNLTFSP